MTKEELAAKLDGREYGEEITREESEQAKADGIVCDEAGCWGGGTIMFDATGIFPKWEDADISTPTDAIEWGNRKLGVKTIEAVWDGGPDEPAWTYKTDVPHATFEIWEDGAVFCRGIVIDEMDLR